MDPSRPEEASNLLKLFVRSHQHRQPGRADVTHIGQIENEGMDPLANRLVERLLKRWRRVRIQPARKLELDEVGIGDSPDLHGAHRPITLSATRIMLSGTWIPQAFAASRFTNSRFFTDRRSGIPDTGSPRIMRAAIAPESR